VHFGIALFPLIRIGLYVVVVLEIIKPISEKNRFNVGYVLNDYFNRLNPQDDDAKL